MNGEQANDEVWNDAQTNSQIIAGETQENESGASAVVTTNELVLDPWAKDGNSAVSDDSAENLNSNNLNNPPNLANVNFNSAVDSNWELASPPPPPLEFADAWGNESDDDDSNDNSLRAPGSRSEPLRSYSTLSQNPSASVGQMPFPPMPRSDVYWKLFAGKFVPPDAIPLGRDTDGAPLFATRASYKDGIHVGKAHNNAGCYISFGGKELLLPDDVEYEILCGNPGAVEWIPAANKLSRSLVSSRRLIAAGFEKSGPQFIGTCDTYFNGSPIGKCGPALSGLHYPYGGKEIVAANYRVAAYAPLIDSFESNGIDTEMSSLNSSNTETKTPSSLLSTSVSTAAGSSAYWRVSAVRQIPDDAIRIGRDADGLPFYAGRVKVSNGGVQVGKVTAVTGCAIGFGGRELNFQRNFEILCGDSLAIDFVEIEGAVSLMKLAALKPVAAGHEENGMPLYVAVHEAFGAVHVGKCSPSLPGCHFPHAGKEQVGLKYRMVVYRQ
ncbi:hypothetical protein HK100_007915 [Physocladia obscura]|uniref:Uncharacterized protein n=1 Tax=Physocladia obscura TaxID=109957 RepID=A0AAD5T5F1_9FUNG|nr:hypothetical protein HK100_007915 [Physocladia obscura]